MSIIREIGNFLGFTDSFAEFCKEIVQNPEKIVEKEDGTIEYDKYILRATEDNFGWAPAIR